MIEKKVGTVSTLGDQKVLVVTSLKIMRKIHTLILEKTDLVIVPIMAKTAGTSSSAEFKRLSSELNSRISREMDEMMNSVSVQIQRAINDAISSQVLPQIQKDFKAGP